MGHELEAALRHPEAGGDQMLRVGIADVVPKSRDHDGAPNHASGGGGHQPGRSPDRVRGHLIADTLSVQLSHVDASADNPTGLLSVRDADQRIVSGDHQGLRTARSH